ncbi:hypothetical protein [Anaerophilus nitritogenes]|uniref:hypothetical protein n=1 Tax=Anaerophilus nitritogenes TaxID=2498136 RepID=UPI00101BF1A6|nr:hypothetical protein [Anaerophilus nitritogenes]
MGSPKREKSLLGKLEEITTTKKAYWILWKYKVQYQDCTFQDICKKFLGGNLKEEDAEKYLLEEDVQRAIKYLLKILHNNKMIELYQIYFEKAKKDVQAFKAFTDFSKSFFADEKENELVAILNEVGDDIDG